ncbi:MAG: hypothetical protein JSR82_05780 [Verrucomicrobia bacterium]|nr:hypothetical protein [Verrucomicrobiota bacterium]
MKNLQYAWENEGESRSRVPIAQPDLSGMDSVDDIIRDAARCGLLEALAERLGSRLAAPLEDRLSVAQEIAIELAHLDRPGFAIDLLICATRAGEYGSMSLRDYAERHGCSHEWFRLEAQRLGTRLELTA